jgi:ribosomal protein S18 acetylase RimI-like enzyme
MQIKLVPQSKTKRVVYPFSKKEWGLFNRERGYRWDPKEYTFCAFDGKKVVGFANIEMNGGAAYLAQILVAKSYRRRGIGQMLLDRFEKFSKARRCHVAYLDTTEAHKEALKFYRRNGYKRVAKLSDNRFHLDRYYLSKRLS